MKKLIAALALALMGSAAFAGTLVMQTTFRSISVVGVDIASAPATSIVGGTGNGWAQVCVQNVDTTNALYCGDTVNVSSLTATSSLAGVIVPPAASATAPSSPTCFNIVADGNFFCRTGKVTGSTRAVVVKAK